MTALREAAQMIRNQDLVGWTKAHDVAVLEAIEIALAQPEQEPRRVRMERVDEAKGATWWNEAARIKMPSPDLYALGDTILCWVNEGDYYAQMHTSPPQREWQGLTDSDYEAMAEKYVTNCYFDTLKYARAIEARLRENNS